MEIISLITTAVASLSGGLVSALCAALSAGKRLRKRHKAADEGLQCLLRGEIIRTYEKAKERGYCPLYVKEATKRAYSSYHALGGNDVATDLYHHLLQMETEKKEEKRDEENS